MKVVRTPDRLEIEIDHRSLSGWFLAAIGMTISIGIMLASQLPAQNGERTRENVIALLVMGPTIGIPILFLGLAIGLNKSRIIADRNELLYQVGPIPFLPGRKSIS